MKVNYRYLMLGIVLLLIVLAIIKLQSLKPEAKISTVKQEIREIITQPKTQSDTERIALKAKKYPKAKELVAPDGYLNTKNITIAENIGKNVILIDFWTYSCINCQRTIPYIEAWYEKYKDKGLIIIGVHTPEFDFEKEYVNVKRAIEKFNITYPVVQDNKYQTWRAYENQYWPRKYLIDIDGFIVFDHIGEGGYEETEMKIQYLLEERNQVLNVSKEITKEIAQLTTEDTNFDLIQSPEIYFGYQYARDQIGNKEGWQPEKVVTYKLPSKIARDQFYLNGQWFNRKDNMELTNAHGSITLRYFAKSVNLVAGANTKKPVTITIKVDGKETKTITVKNFDLYTVVANTQYGEHTLEIEAEPGLMAYTFTFG